MAAKRPIANYDGRLKELQAGDTVDGVPGASGAAGTAEIDFGAFPGADTTVLAITGQTGILAGSSVRAVLMPKQTADHSVDEHVVDGPTVMAGDITPGVGFKIFARAAGGRAHMVPGPKTGALRRNIQNSRAYGLWSVAWQWS